MTYNLDKSRSEGFTHLLLIALLVVGFAVGGTYFAISGKADTPVPAPTRCVNVALAAHRGSTAGLDVGPTQDTLNAFKSSAPLAATYGPKGLSLAVETDIWKTKATSTIGSYWVNNHNATVGATTNGTGTISNMTYTQISKLLTNDGQHMTSFSAAISYMKTTKANFQVEIKPSAVATADLDHLISVVQSSGMGSRFEFTTFSPTVAKNLHTELVKKGVKTVKIGLLTTSSVPTGVQTYANHVIFESAAATPAAIAKVHALGIKVGAWTPDTTTEWQTLVTDGIDMIITNQPIAYNNWCLPSPPTATTTPSATQSSIRRDTNRA